MRAIICIFLIFVCCIFTASALDDYDYYQSISYSACDQEIYQQDIVIHRTTGDPYEESSSGLNITHLYLNDHCQANYGDIRFTNPAGDELSYYLWSDFDSESAYFCVRLEGATSAGALTIHYGNPTATTTSDGDAAFHLFDQFDGTAIDTGKWDVIQSGGLSVSGGELRASKGTNRYCEISSRSTVPSNILIQFRIQSRTYYTSIGFGNADLSGTGSSIGLTYYTNYESAIYSGPSAYNKWIPHRSQASSSTDGDVIPSPPTGYYTEEFVIPEGGKLKERRNGGEWTVSTRYSGVSGPKNIQFYHTGTYAAAALDYILVRAYSATPPTASDFSGEIYAGYVRSYPGYNIPTDPDADGLYEDVNGNGRLDFQDIMIFFQYNAWAKANQPKVECWDWSGNGAIEFSDVQAFWEAEFT